MADNSARVVRWDITPDGILMRIWIDDFSGRHLAVADLALDNRFLQGMRAQVEQHRAREAQPSLF